MTSLTAEPQSQAREQLIEALEEFFDRVFAPLEAWQPRLEAQLRERLHRGPITGAALIAIAEGEAHRILESTNLPLYGAGYCATDEVVGEGNPLAWWQGPERSLLASSTFGPGQAAIDLQRLEWYRVPAATLTRHVAGPFVDYLCSNEITLTSSLPLMLDGRFAGVMCADVLVASLEDLLLPMFARLNLATLTNANGRVIVSADPSYETGDHFDDGDAVRSTRSSLQVTESQCYPFMLYSHSQPVATRAD